jgi:uncharacterized protein YjbI with pentapeptide repeats
MKTKIQIKSIGGDILFEFKKENNTIKDTVEEAVKQKVNLSYASLIGANLHEADLCFAHLRGADLRHTNLRMANISWADLSGANLSGASLYDAKLNRANLSGADLRYANLSFVCLRGADLRKAYLSGANLRLPNLSWADLSGAENIPYIPLNCPSEGAFIGWKKVAGKLVKLEVPEDAKRSSATTNKCRCDKAKVLSITDLDGSNPIDEILNTAREHDLLYKVGKMVYPDWFDEDRWNECSHGIHFFINKQDAINY